MGFLGKTVFAKRLNKTNLFVLAVLVSTILCAVVSVGAYAEVQSAEGIFTDANDVRWEYVHVVDTETSKEAVAIKYFDKPASMTTIVIPSLSDVIANVPNASQSLDTYYLDDANSEYQTVHFTETKRESTAQINKLDMSNTAKIQILGIKPMIDSETETELVFGEQMVISDVLSGGFTVSICNEFVEWRGYYRCDNLITKSYGISDIRLVDPSWYLLSTEERRTRSYNLNDYASLYSVNLSSDRLSWARYGNEGGYYLPAGVTPDSSMWYFQDFTTSVYMNPIDTGVFAGYKLKLTNLGNFNYVGWGAFNGATLSEDNSTITVLDGFDGDSIFMDTNVRKVILTNNHYGDRIFANCSSITEIDFGEADTISTEMFMGANLGSLDLSNTSIKTIQARGFKSTNLSSLNIEGVQRLEHQAFMDNDELTEIYLPKSINWLGGALFEDCDNIIKATIAYDTLTSGTASTFHAAFQNASDSFYSQSKLEELVILAPYAEDEEVSPTHVTYNDYKWHWHYSNEWVDNNFDRTSGNAYGWTHNTGYEREYASEDQFAHVDTYKNVIAPVYFSQLKSLKKITIGEGYEYIGAMAFWDTGYNPGKSSYLSADDWLSFEENNGYASGQKMFERITLPSTLKGVGNLAFNSIGGKDIGLVIPEGIEYIGIAAFRGVMSLEIENFDFPNLKFLGDEAFMATRVKNVVLHDSLEYFGRLVFANCPYIHDVTIDFDIYNPAKNAYYNPSRPYIDGSNVFGEYQNDTLRTHFGVSTDYWGDNLSDEQLDRMGVEYSIRKMDGKRLKKYGTIKYTDKVVTNYPNNAQYNSANNGPYFAALIMDKVDLGDCGWTVIKDYFFSAATIGEVVLPHGLTSIGKSAFNTTSIDKELIIPDSVYGISPEAFNQARVAKNGYETIKITKLPSSLQYVQDYVFYGDSNLTAPINVDLKTAYRGAFTGTGVTDIVLKDSLIFIEETAFVGIPTLKNITIDFDLAGSNIYNSHYNFVNLFNQANEAPYDDVVLNLENLTFTSKNQTAPVSSQMKSWPYCEYGVYVSGNYGYCYYEDGTHSYSRLTPRETYTTSFFYNVNANKIDLSETGWNSIPLNMFLNVKANELLLPNNIEEIPSAAFYNAEIGGELKIPDGVKHIGVAFANAKFDTIILPIALETAYNSPFWEAEAETVIIPEGTKVITQQLFNGLSATTIEIPQSIEKIGESAFYNNEFLAMDLDLPNLKEIGKNAFMKTSIRDVVLHDKLESIGEGAFQYVPTLRNLTFDCDFYGINNNHSFYSIFSTTDRNKTSQTQITDIATFGKITFTDKNITTPYGTSFLAFNIDEFDMSNVKWEEISGYTFFKTTINKPVVFPSSVKLINGGAFQWANFKISNGLPEGLEKILYAAFYGADCFDDLVIPSTITVIQPEAFNAGDRDVHYNSVIVKPKTFTYIQASGQAIFQMFWNTKIDKLIIESEVLPIMSTLDRDDSGKYIMESGHFVCYDDNDTFKNSHCYNAAGEETLEKQKPEFHGMNFKEVTLTSVKAITSNAFEECAELEKVDLAQNGNLEYIGRNAFLHANKLTKVAFGDGLKGKDVSIGEYAFRGTAIETIGEEGSGFDLTAAHFNTNIMRKKYGIDDEILYITDAHVFSDMPKLKSVYVPGTFSIDASLANEEVHTNGSTIPSYTFADDPELETVEVGYDLSIIHEDAFANDNKLNKIFLWGNTDIEENGTNLTIPEPTNIFAYSDAPGQEYANSDTRSEYSGKFYPLDEVLYLTSNKTYVLLEQDEEGNIIDFDKDGLILYALRRDGVILESDDWQTYTKAYPRSTVNINFEQGRGGNIGTDENIMWNVYDARKPFDLVSLANENYAATSFEFMQMPSSDNPLIVVHYPDGYTGNIRNTTLVSMLYEPEPEPTPQPTPTPEPQPEDELEVPDTGSYGALIGAATSSVSIATIIVLGGIFIAKRRR